MSVTDGEKRSLEGKVAIVTGAGRGTGAAIAHRMAAAGARVTVNDINPDRAESVAAEIRSNGGLAIGIMADVSNKFQCVTLIEAARAEWGQLDILVNTASVKPRSTILKLDEWDWQRCLDVNLKGTFFMSQLCGRVMADENRERRGVIVNIGLINRKERRADLNAAYQASIAGVLGFSRACAVEFDQYGIRVYAVLEGQGLPEFLEMYAGDPVPVLASEPGGSAEGMTPYKSVADAVLQLCSDVSAAPTGATIITSRANNTADGN